MMNRVVTLTASNMNMGERASVSGIVTLQGMLAIFLILAILWGVIEIMHLLFHKGEKQKKKEKVSAISKPKESQALAPNANDSAVAAAIAAALAASEDNGATVAAITAAISAMRAEQGLTGGFRVVSFQRAKSANQRKFY